ncbi:DUF4998 domain-containing protein [Halosquirtibacter laminarini]|uniref:DUF4998 domain-containing protein n=1 Tax=Halosquirtibacter laminarini TaxID=3374600 RepID=A0AC61NHX5_9BACT|nr:DUF4998 domain-containing protein [Prolixibacteraceae bacterium]
MKKYIYIIALFLSLWGVTSCDDAYSSYEDFIQDGEQSYSPVIDSLDVFSGNERIKIVAGFNNAPNVKALKVTWKSGDSIRIMDIENKGIGEQYYDVILDNFPEGIYLMRIASVDKFDNTSLTQLFSVRTYGDFYISNLKNRKIDSKSLNGNTLVLNWKLPEQYTEKTVISYTNTEGDEAQYTVDDEENTSTIENVDGNSKIEYQTYFNPEGKSIDLFSSLKESIEL